MAIEDLAVLGLEVDSSKVRNADRDLDNFTSSAKRAETGAAGMVTRFRDAASSVAVLQGPLGGVAGRITSIGSLIDRAGPAMAAGAIAAASLATVVVKAVNAYEDFEKQSNTLEAVIKATGGAAGKTREDIEQLAHSIGSISEVREAATQLLTFRSIAGDVFDRTLKAADDLAAVGFGSIQSAAFALGRALEDPEQGLNMLRRAGISFSEAQRQVIQNFIQTGQTARAQSAILDVVEKQVGGAGNAHDQGLTGAYEHLSDATQTLLERWGEQITIGGRLADVVNLVASGLERIASADIAPKIGLFLGAIPGIGSILGTSASAELGRRLTAATSGSNVPWLSSVDQSVLDEDAWKSQQAREISQRDASQRAQDQLATDRFNGVISGLQKQESAAKATTLADKVLAAQQEAGVAPTSERGKAIASLVTQIYNEDKATKASEQAGQHAIDYTKQLTAATQERVAALQFEIDHFDEQGAQLERARFLEDALSDARQQQVKLSPAYIAALEQEADRYAALSDQLQRLNDLRDLSVEGAHDLFDAIDSWASGARSAEEAVDDLGAALLRMAEQAFLLGEGPLAGLLGTQSQSGGLLGSLVSGAAKWLGLGGSSVSNPTPSSWLHGGGVVGDPSNRAVYVHPAYFDHAPRMHGGGAIGSDERPIIGKVGEVVGWPSQMREAYGGGQTVQIIDQRGASAKPVETQRSRGPNGQELLKVFIRDQVQSEDTVDWISKRFGASPAVTLR